MSATSTVLQASIGGSLELLALSGSGALLSHLGHFSASISAALSNAVYKLFLPALVLVSILETVNHALSGTSAAMQDVWVPLAAAVGIFVVTAVVSHPLTMVMARGKEVIVRRVIWTCVVLGNSNTMALLVMQSICDSFGPLKEDPTCLVRSTGYASLYITVVTVFTWTIIFQYLCDAPDSSPNDPEHESLLPSTTDPDEPPPAPKKKASSFRTLLKRGLLSPPSLAVLLGIILACIPNVPALFVNERGLLRPLLLAVNEVGSVAIPLSSMIVGAELHRALTEPQAGPAAVYRASRPSQRFGSAALALILVLRLVALPWLGRTLHRALGLTERIHDPLLSVFALVEWTVPTANNCIIMVSIVAERLPVLGARLREDVSKCLFWQYLALPVFLTVNTTLALWLQFPDA